MSIQVEIEIRRPIAEVWRVTQDPAKHVRWDLRFTNIEYEPRPDASLPQQFVYQTRMGGVMIEGHGETVGSGESGRGERVSALQFWSDDPKSLIREGAGYWKYIPVGDSVRFITAYDYRVRYGLVGLLVDMLVFRPWMTWATAWSFDRLRLCLEKGIDPRSSLRMSLIHWCARIAVAFVWLYQGIAPKLYHSNGDELAMLADAGLSGDQALLALNALGWLEVAMAIVLLTARRPARPFAVTIVLMAVATIAVAIASPLYLTAAFNPVSLNIVVAVTAGIGWLSSRDLPCARNCIRSWSVKQ